MKNPKWLLATLAVALALLSGVLYWPVSRHEFVNYDDPVYVTTNPHVLGGLNGASVNWALTGVRGSNWHPLTWMSHMLDVELFGLKAGPHHLVNLGLHGLNAACLLLVFWRATRRVWPSALVAALFAWHPLHVESVAWLSERKDVLSTCFGLMSLWFYTGFARADDSPAAASRRRGNYALSLGCFGLGLLAKPMLVTLPFVMLLWDAWPFQRATWLRGDREVWLRLAREKIPFFVLTLASCTITFLAQAKGGAVASWEHVPWPMRLGNALVAYASYLQMAVWPVDLAVFYPHPGAWPAGRLMWSAIVVLGLTAAVIWQRQRRHLVVGWFWFLGTLIPVIGFIQVGDQAFADRYTYLPLIGIFAGIAFALFEWSAGSRLRGCLSLAASLAALAGCVVVTHHQLAYWQNGETLFQRALAVTQNNYVAHNNLGNIYAETGRLEAARREYDAALAIMPSYEDAHLNLGALLLQQNEPAEAIAHFERALRLKPGSAEGHYNLATALAQQGRDESAVAEFERAIALKPDHARAHYNLGISLVRLGNLPSAEAHFRASLRIDPYSGSAHYNLGLVLAEQNQLQEAETEYNLATRYSPEFVPARMQLGALLLQTDRFDEAAGFYAAILQQESTNALAHNNLGLALARQGKTGEALEHFQTVTRLEPANADAHYNLANALAETGELKAAVFHYGEAVRLNPADERARDKLARLKGRLAADELLR